MRATEERALKSYDGYLPAAPAFTAVAPAIAFTDLAALFFVFAGAMQPLAI